MSKLFILLFVGILQGNFGKEFYRGYHVIVSNKHDHLLDELGLKEDYENDKIRSLRDDQSSIMVHPSEVQSVVKLLENSKIDFNIVTRDFQKNIDEEIMIPKNAGWFDSYHKFDEILQWLNQKMEKHSKYTSLHTIGQSYHKRPLQVMKIVGEKSKCTNKPSIWIDSGMHAREWITHSTGMYLIERLLEDYDKDPFVKYMRNTYDWYFLVVANPDGYEYSWTENRCWRKTRSPNKGTQCKGTDINRNFDYKYLKNEMTCEDTYAGTKAFSESESKALADFILKKNGTWDLFITLHSYGHLWLSPWGYTRELPNNYPQLERVGKEIVKAIYKSSGMNYRFGSVVRLLNYFANGNAMDWAHGVAKIPLVYAPELRGDGSFIIPPSEIIPTGMEIWEGVKACIKEMKTELPPSCKP